MNDALKLLSQSLKPFGYHIRKHSTPNLLKIRALENNENTQNITAPRLSLNTRHTTKDANLNHMVIYMRTCIRANRNIDTRSRITQVNLEENTLRCLRSLVASIEYSLQTMTNKSIELIILDDRSDPTPLANITKALQPLTCPYRIEQTIKTGQGHSLHQQFSNAKLENALAYFVEDDYLHEQDAIKICWDFYEQTLENMNTHCVLYPQEHPVLYSDHYPSYIILGKDRHWRTIRHTTHTFITHTHIVRDFWRYFENTKYVCIRKKRKLGSEARTTNKLFKHMPAFSPMKPAAIHLQFKDTVPPLYDWQPLWKKMKK